MSTKISIASGESFHLFTEDFTNNPPNFVSLELMNPSCLRVGQDKMKDKNTTSVSVEMDATVMDEIAIAWVRKRKLQGSCGGPVGAEFGGPDCPYS